MYSVKLIYPKLTKQEKENAKAMFIFDKYKKSLETAKIFKGHYLICKEHIANGLQTKNLKECTEAMRLGAIQYFNESQVFLKQYQEFEENRKYPN